jgi:hypothetical protein
MNKKVLIIILVLLMLGFTPVSVKAYGGERIDSTTFRSNYNITSIHIGSDVDEITSTAFRGLNNLQAITVSDNNAFYSSYSGCLYDKFYSELICFPPALSGAYIPNTVVSIAPYALHGVPEKLKQAVRMAVEGNAAENSMEWDVPGEHFVHAEGGIKWMREDGTIISPDSDLMNQVAALVDRCTDSNMRQSEQLQSAFDCLCKSLVYSRSYETPSGDWCREYAQTALRTGTTNCYGYAASFAYIAKGLGYDARVCTGTIVSSLGGRADHAWTEVRIGKKWYVFDAEMQDAKGAGYYRVTYDEYPAGPIEKSNSYAVSF